MQGRDRGGEELVSDALPQDAEPSDADEEATAATAEKPRSKKRLIVVAAALLVLAGGGGGAAYMMLGSGSHEGEAEAEAPAEAAAYIDVPPMTVNLRSADGQARFLKVRFVLVPREAAEEAKLKEKLPLILDAFQPFLRELRPEDLAGSAAVFRLKEEMIVRAARVVGPDIVRDVLIQDLIQQ